MIFTSCEKPTPICNMMLFLSFQIAILLKHTHQSLEPKIGFLRFIRSILIAAVVELILIILDRWWLLLLIIVDILIGVGLSFSLIPDLVVDVGIFSCYFLVVYQKSYFTFSVAQFVSVLLYFLSCSECLCQGLVFHKDVGSLGWKLVSFYLEISYETVFAEKTSEILLVGVLGVVSN